MKEKTIMITVSKEQFYQVIGKLNVHPQPVGSYPYQTHWKLSDGRVVGLDDGKEYKIAKELA